MGSLYKKPITIADRKTGEKITTKSKKWWGQYLDGSARPPVATQREYRSPTRPAGAVAERSSRDCLKRPAQVTM